MYETEDKNFDELWEREQFKAKRRRRRKSECLILSHLNKWQFWCHSMAYEPRYEIVFSSLSFFPFHPSSFTSLCHTRHPDREPVCGLKGTRYSVAEFTPPFYPQFRAFPFLSTPSPFPALALSSLFPPAFSVWKRTGKESSPLLSSRFLCAFRARAWRDSPRT